MNIPSYLKPSPIFLCQAHIKATHHVCFWVPVFPGHRLTRNPRQFLTDPFPLQGEQFPDRLLCCSTPTINRYIRLQVIVWIIRASVTNSYGMSMCTSLFGCFCALIRTPWSWSRFCTTCVVFFYKSKSMRVIPACTNRYIVVMFRQFSDRKIRKDDNLWNVFKYWTVRF